MTSPHLAVWLWNHHRLFDTLKWKMSCELLWWLAVNAWCFLKCESFRSVISQRKCLMSLLNSVDAESFDSHYLRMTLKADTRFNSSEMLIFPTPHGIDWWIDWFGTQGNCSAVKCLFFLPSDGLSMEPRHSIAFLLFRREEKVNPQPSSLSTRSKRSPWVSRLGFCSRQSRWLSGAGGSLAGGGLGGALRQVLESSDTW